MKLPIYFGIQTLVTSVDVLVGVAIPLLLSLQTLEKLELVIDCKNQTISSELCNVHDLYVRRLGKFSNHLLLPLFQPPKPKSFEEILFVEPETAVEHIFSVVGKSPSKKRRQQLHALRNRTSLTKLHQALGHASKDKTLLYIVSIGGDRKEFTKLLDDIISKCTVCQRFKTRLTKSTGTGWTASNPNQFVCGDLTEFVLGSSKVLIFLLIDVFSRYSFSRVIPSKQATETLRIVLEYAANTGSFPATLFTDNGSEFVNTPWLQLCDRYNINHLCSVVYKPFLNGIVERRNKIMKSTLIKTIQDFPEFSVSTMVIETSRIMNTIPDTHGYSSFRKMFLREPTAYLPTDIDDLAPSQFTPLQNMPAVIKEREILLEQLRKEVFANQCSDKIHKALTKRMRHGGGPFARGEIVYKYKPNKVGDDLWEGPYVVVGPIGDSQYAIMRQGKMDRATENELDRKIGFHSVDPNTLTESPDFSTDDYLDPDVVSSLLQEELSRKNESRTTSTICAPRVVGAHTDDQRPKCDACGVGVDSLEDLDLHKRYFCRNTESVNMATSSSSNDKSNVSKFEVFEKSSIYPELPVAKNTADISRSELGTYSKEISHAKRLEIDSWFSTDAVCPVSDVPFGANVISTRWVLKWKLRENGTILKPKCRLVLRGYEDLERDSMRVDSPTVTALSLRLVLQIVASKDWDLVCIDLKTAFLQGLPYTDRKVYCRIPSEIRQMLSISEEYFLLRKSIYGLNDAPRRFFLRLQDFLLSIGYTQSSLDKCVFVMRNESGIVVSLLCTHVDDLLISGIDSTLTSVVSRLSTEFSYGKLERNSFLYCGVHITKSSDSIVSLTQFSYCDALKEVPVSSRPSQSSQPLTPDLEKQLRSTIGKLSWLSCRTRPDLTYGTNTSAIRSESFELSHLNRINKLVRQAKLYSNLSLRFIPHRNSTSLLVFSDSSFGNNSDYSSQSGYLIFLASRDSEHTRSQNVSLLDWNSTKLRRITHSTLASETLSLTAALDQTLYVKQLWSEISDTTDSRLSIYAYTDCKSLYDSVHSDTQTIREKRLLIEIASLRQLLSNRDVEQISHIRTEYMLADALTKEAASKARDYLISVLYNNELVV